VLEFAAEEDVKEAERLVLIKGHVMENARIEA